MVLLDKYLYGRPTHRLCEELKHQGLPVAQGTLTDGLQRIAVLFEPVMQALHARQMREMDRGKIVEQGDPAQFFAAPREERTRQFLSQILH